MNYSWVCKYNCYNFYIYLNYLLVLSTFVYNKIFLSTKTKIHKGSFLMSTRRSMGIGEYPKIWCCFIREGFKNQKKNSLEFAILGWVDFIVIKGQHRSVLPWSTPHVNSLFSKSSQYKCKKMMNLFFSRFFAITRVAGLVQIQDFFWTLPYNCEWKNVYSNEIDIVKLQIKDFDNHDIYIFLCCFQQ